MPEMRLEGEWDVPFQGQPEEQVEETVLQMSCAVSDLEAPERERPVASVSVIVLLLS